MNKQDSSDFLLTTSDNPWDPFTNFDEWNQYDTECGYNTWQRIERLMPEGYLRKSLVERNSLLTEVMENLINLFPSLYVKVFDLNKQEETETN